MGLLHEEMRRLDSIIMQSADKHKLPAGSALAMDRDGFSAEVNNILSSHPSITIISEEITALPEEGFTIIATGPLTSDALSSAIKAKTGEEHLAFFDAIAPIIYRESINFDIAWMQSRYDKGDKDYINCPLNKEQYYQFVEAILAAEKTEFKEWENVPYFDGCLPIEVMAERGIDTLRFGPMKPVGLVNPRSGKQEYAVVQLRQDNKLGSLYNMVGFQTKLKYGEQKRIFTTIPGLEGAEFARFGGLHRNSFIKSPVLLDSKLRLKNYPHIRFAGQITGVEGYVESAAIGLLAGIFTYHDLHNSSIAVPPGTTAMGALLNHITESAEIDSFQPMNINFGLFAPIEMRAKKTERKVAMSKRALVDLDSWQQNNINLANQPALL